MVVYDDLGTQVLSQNMLKMPLLAFIHSNLLWDQRLLLLHDADMQEALEEFAPASATRIYVGKRGQRQSIKQSDIDDILVNQSLQV